MANVIPTPHAAAMKANRTQAVILILLAAVAWAGDLIFDGDGYGVAVAVALLVSAIVTAVLARRQDSRRP